MAYPCAMWLTDECDGCGYCLQPKYNQEDDPLYIEEDDYDERIDAR